MIPGAVRLRARRARRRRRVARRALEAAIARPSPRSRARRGVEASVAELRGGRAGRARRRARARPRSRPPRARGIAAEPTWSGAGHDAQHLAALVPTLLLFVPLRGGESHTPFEDADPAQIEAATLLALEVLSAR